MRMPTTNADPKLMLLPETDDGTHYTMQDFLVIAKRSPFDLHNDYQRTIIQLCFVLMYSVTWPMCALVCFCFNMAR